MPSSVLNSQRAVEVNILRLLIGHADLARKLDELERKYDAQFKVVFDAFRELMKPPEPRKRAIGFREE